MTPLHVADARLRATADGALLPHTSRSPAQLSVKTVFIRGSVVRYVHVPAAAVDTELLQDAARREAMEAAKQPAAGGGRK